MMKGLYLLICCVVVLLILLFDLLPRAKEPETAATPIPFPTEIVLEKQRYSLAALGEIQAPTSTANFEVKSREILQQMQRFEHEHREADMVMETVISRGKRWTDMVSALNKGINEKSKDKSIGGGVKPIDKNKYMGPITGQLRVALKQDKWRIEVSTGEDTDEQVSCNGEKIYSYFPMSNDGSIMKGSRLDDTNNVLHNIGLRFGKNQTLSEYLILVRAKYVGVQSVGAVRCYKYKFREGNVLSSLWISPADDYQLKRMTVQHELPRHPTIWICDVAAYARSGGRSYPASGCMALAEYLNDDGDNYQWDVNVLRRWNVFSYAATVPDEAFDMIFPPGTKVSDAIANREYVVDRE